MRGRLEFTLACVVMASLISVTGCRSSASCEDAPEGPPVVVSLTSDSLGSETALLKHQTFTVATTGDFGAVASTDPSVVAQFQPARTVFGKRTYYFATQSLGAATLEARSLRTGVVWKASVSVTCRPTARTVRAGAG